MGIKSFTFDHTIVALKYHVYTIQHTDIGPRTGL